VLAERAQSAFGTDVVRSNWVLTRMQQRGRRPGPTGPGVGRVRRSGASEELLDAAVQASASLALELGRAGSCGLSP
jgi:hypothetical protein